MSRKNKWLLSSAVVGLSRKVVSIGLFLSYFVHFRTMDSKPKQLSLPVVLFPKKGANKYSQHVYSLSVTLQHSHL